MKIGKLHILWDKAPIASDRIAAELAALRAQQDQDTMRMTAMSERHLKLMVDALCGNLGLHNGDSTSY